MYTYLHVYIYIYIYNAALRGAGPASAWSGSFGETMMRYCRLLSSAERDANTIINTNVKTS